MAKAIILVGLVACLFAVAQAQSADEFLAMKRTIFMTLSSTDVLLESRTLNPINRNRFEVEYMGEPTNQFSLQTRAWRDTSLTSAGFVFTVRFARIVEYMELDGIPGFSSGDNMTVNHPYNIGSVTFTEDANTTDSNGNIIYHFHGSTPEASPVFTIRGRMVSVQTVVDGMVVIPSSHKFDVIIVPNWTPATGSRLALITFVDVATSTGFHPINSTSDQDREQVTTVHLGDATLPTATFNWVSNVTINSDSTNIAQVIVGSFEKPQLAADLPTDPNINRLQVAFSIDSLAPSRIEWDPSVAMGAGSVGTVTSSTGSASTPSDASRTATAPLLAVASAFFAVAIALLH